MKKRLGLLCLTGMLLLPLTAPTLAGPNRQQAPQRFDWNPIIDAIVEVESEGNPRAVSGRSCGILQITPILVEECNRILTLRNSTKRYAMADRYDVGKSKEMFLLYQSHYNPRNDIEQAIRSWNGGMNYTKRGTQRYYEKVMRCLKQDVTNKNA